jgi:hypothetical protein
MNAKHSAELRNVQKPTPIQGKQPFDDISTMFAFFPI